MRILETHVFQFAELSAEAQERAIDSERNNENYLSYEWWDSDKEDLIAIADLMGIDIKDTYFSGFWSQGDGACFTGTYTYKKGSVQAVKDYVPNDTELHSIVRRLQEAQKKYFYKLSAKITHSGHYYHNNSVTIDVEHENENVSLPTTRYYKDDTGIDEALRDLMKWYYRQLQSQYNWLMSDEAIKESLISNEKEFTENGFPF